MNKCTIPSSLGGYMHLSATLHIRNSVIAYIRMLPVIGPRQFGHLTVDILLTKISHVDKVKASLQLGL